MDSMKLVGSPQYLCRNFEIREIFLVPDLICSDQEPFSACDYSVPFFEVDDFLPAPLNSVSCLKGKGTSKANPCPEKS